MRRSMSCTWFWKPLSTELFCKTESSAGRVEVRKNWDEKNSNKKRHVLYNYQCTKHCIWAITEVLHVWQREDLNSDVIIERFGTPLFMHCGTWVAGRSIEDRSCVYIDEGKKKKEKKKSLHSPDRCLFSLDQSATVSLPRRNASGVPLIYFDA